MSRRRTRGKPIATSFIAHSVEMRRSVAWRSLPHDSRLFLDFLELEHMAHGGRENGELRAPYADLERAGIRRKSIAPAIRACVALGFVRVTRQGQPAISTHRTASTYRLTYLVSRDDTPPRTDDWKGVASEANAHEAIGQAKLQRSAEHVRRAGKGDTLRAAGATARPCTGYI